MVHSIELVFDPDTETTIRGLWAALAAAGIPSQAPASRPHVTLTVAEHIDPAVDALLAATVAGLPLDCTLGAPLLVGRGHAVLARLVVPSSALLALHAEVYRLSRPLLAPGPMPHTAPGQWTGHVTCARHVGPAQLARAVRIAGRPASISGRFAGLRRWDGGKRVEYPLGC